MSKARQLADLGNVYDDGALSNRNMVVNGGMTVNQRGDVTGKTNTGTYGGPDRFALQTVSSGTWSISQSSTAPEGFANSYKLDCTTANASLAAGAYLYAQTILEGQNLQQLKKGTANALPVTLSFWVRSNKTGTYTVALRDVDNSRHIASTYTISVADTWEYKTITYAGDTTGAFTNDNNASLHVNFWLGAGTNFTSGTISTSWASLSDANRVSSSNVNLADNTANDWYLTGVQLEIGDTATPFEHRSYGDELQRCQRYFNRYKTEGGFALIVPSINGGTTNARCALALSTKLRTTPTITSSSSDAILIRNNGSFTTYASTAIGLGSEQQIEPNFVALSVSVASGLTSASVNIPYINSNGYIDCDAEL